MLSLNFRSGKPDPNKTPADAAACATEDVSIPAGKHILHGTLSVPEDARGIVIFAHGSGSGRHSPRNKYVASVLNSFRLATLLADLLTLEEEAADAETREFRFDVSLLARRVSDIAAWSARNVATKDLPTGYFGASTGAAAALTSAARHPQSVRAVVSRGGRPDLAADKLATVRAPTLLIVGERDQEVLELNRRALQTLNDQSRLDIVPRATHLFEEPGALEAVAQLSAEWFVRHMGNG